jgi:Gas vesicle synthesis protein GvpL/GvpF
MADPLQQWLADRAPEVLARAEAEAVALLRDHLVRAALAGPSRPVRREEAPASAPAASASPAASGDGVLLWAYCVVDAGAPMSLDGLHGVHGEAPVEVVAAGELAVLVSRVPRADFAAEPLREHLNDLPWLERVARAHERVLDAALRATTVVPLRLCTIYESDERVRAMLADDHEALAEALTFLANRQEWGAKVLLDRERLLVSDGPDLSGRTEGGAYLERRRLDRQARERAEEQAAEIAQVAHARLRHGTVDAVTRPPQNRDLSGHEGEMVVNAAYLVEADDIGALRERAASIERDFAHLGARVELTGPWPPYNFLPRHGAAAQP